MDIHTDPRTGQPLDDLETPRATASSSKLSVIVLLIGIVLAGWYVVARGPSPGVTTTSDALMKSAHGVPSP